MAGATRTIYFRRASWANNALAHARASASCPCLPPPAVCFLSSCSGRGGGVKFRFGHGLRLASGKRPARRHVCLRALRGGRGVAGLAAQTRGVDVDCVGAGVDGDNAIADGLSQRAFTLASRDVDDGKPGGGFGVISLATRAGSATHFHRAALFRRPGVRRRGVGGVPASVELAERPAGGLAPVLAGGAGVGLVVGASSTRSSAISAGPSLMSPCSLRISCCRISRRNGPCNGAPPTRLPPGFRTN